MRHYQSLAGIHLRNAWLTIGSFDGIHLGHQAIVSRLTAGAHAEGAPAVVLTFYPHPGYVLGKRGTPFYLNTPDERAAGLAALGVDVVITHPFDQQVAATPADEFIARLNAHLQIRRLLVGPNFALGRGREGDIPFLQRLGEDFGYTLEVAPVVRNGEQIISSSRVRAALLTGEIEQAAAMLGRPYRLSGTVIPGDGRGHAIGIPTANLEVWAERAIPKAGVYVCRAHIEGETHAAVTNIGVRPTFESQPVSPRVETHLLDFDRDLYGQTIQLEFLSHLRDEQRFPSIQALVEQIYRDIQQARMALAAGQ